VSLHYHPREGGREGGAYLEIVQRQVGELVAWPTEATAPGILSGVNEGDEGEGVLKKGGREGGREGRGKR